MCRSTIAVAVICVLSLLLPTVKADSVLFEDLEDLDVVVQGDPILDQSWAQSFLVSSASNFASLTVQISTVGVGSPFTFELPALRDLSNSWSYNGLNGLGLAQASGPVTNSLTLAVYFAGDPWDATVTPNHRLRLNFTAYGNSTYTSPIGGGVLTWDGETWTKSSLKRDVTPVPLPAAALMGLPLLGGLGLWRSWRRLRAA